MQVLVIDDHPLVAQAIVTVIDALRPDATVRTIDRIEALQGQVFDAPPDLVLLDLTLPGISGLEAFHATKAILPDAAIVIFSAAQDSGTIIAALRTGAKGYIPKTSRHRVLADALQLVLHGGVYVPPDILGPAEPSSIELPRQAAHASRDSGLYATPDPPAPAGAPPLTARQQEIVALLADGLTTKHISRQLGISGNTVKSHIAVIFRTLGVSNRAQLVAVANVRPPQRPAP